MTEDNNPFKVKCEGTIVNEQDSPQEIKALLELRTHLLGEATKLVMKLQDELKGCASRLREQEIELRELREELNKPTGE